jgi:hypothetical protein
MTDVFKTYNRTYTGVSGESKVYNFQYKYIRKKRCNIINTSDIDLFLTSSKSIEEFVTEKCLALKTFKESLLKYFINIHQKSNTNTN